MREFDTSNPVADVELNAIVAGCDNDGVLSGLATTERAAGGAAMFVDVSAGSCVIGGKKYTEGSLTTLTISVADGTNERIDLVYYDVDTTNPKMFDGTPAASPEPPDIPAGDIALALVSVPANDTVISTAQCTDQRVVVQDGLYVPTFSDPARAIDTVYQNTSNRPIMVVVSINLDVWDGAADAEGSAKADFKTDANATPTDVVASAYTELGVLGVALGGSSKHRYVLTAIVQRDHYYWVDTVLTNDGATSLSEWTEYQL